MKSFIKLLIALYVLNLFGLDLSGLFAGFFLFVKKLVFSVI